MMHIEEPVFRWNERNLPPMPDCVPENLTWRWQRSWRSLHRRWRYQMSEDARYWLAMSETIGEACAIEALGNADDFDIDDFLLLG